MSNEVKKKIAYKEAMGLVKSGVMTEEQFEQGVANGHIASNKKGSSLPSFTETNSEGKEVTLSPRLYISGGSSLGSDTPNVTKLRTEVYKVVSKFVKEHKLGNK